MAEVKFEINTTEFFGNIKIICDEFDERLKKLKQIAPMPNKGRMGHRPQDFAGPRWQRRNNHIELQEAPGPPHHKGEKPGPKWKFMTVKQDPDGIINVIGVHPKKKSIYVGIDTRGKVYKSKKPYDFIIPQAAYSVMYLASIEFNK